MCSDAGNRLPMLIVEAHENVGHGIQWLDVFIGYDFGARCGRKNGFRDRSH